MQRSSSRFRLVSKFSPSGDQPKAIESISESIGLGIKSQVLLGVTGSGKTFTVANLVAKHNRPTLVIAHNKTLAAQLYGEFKEFFPDNHVEYFVSYYDYYQPEAYIPSSNTYIEKDASINDQLDKLRHSATMALFEDRDTIIVASVSCIYGLGTPDLYKEMRISVNKGMTINRDKLLEKLVGINYERNNIDFKRGSFRVNGDIVEIIPVYENDLAIRIEFFDDEVERIRVVDVLTGKVASELESVNVYPATHYAVRADILEKMIVKVEVELDQVVERFNREKRYIEAQRIFERTRSDIEMLRATGYCKGIENYSRYLYDRNEGEAPPTLLDYFPEDTLLVIDESHQTVPQLGAMLRGDRSRKENLIRYGFRLPSALDNRPLSFDEFERYNFQTVYVSATPGDYELARSKTNLVEQIIRPTGLVDPEVLVKPVTNQIDDLISESREVIKRSERILVAALTKRQAEDLTDYLLNIGIEAKYLHSDIPTLERMKVISELREGKFDILVGVNLLREGLDIPEVSLVAILSADIEGFLRSERSIIQTSGRAARNLNGKVILYADKMTRSIKQALDEMGRRRAIQLEYNLKNGIKPESVKRSLQEREVLDYTDRLKSNRKIKIDRLKLDSQDEIEKIIKEKELVMKEAARNLDFETAIKERDEIKNLRELILI